MNRKQFLKSFVVAIVPVVAGVKEVSAEGTPRSPRPLPDNCGPVDNTWRDFQWMWDMMNDTWKWQPRIEGLGAKGVSTAIALVLPQITGKNGKIIYDEVSIMGATASQIPRMLQDAYRARMGNFPSPEK